MINNWHVFLTQHELQNATAAHIMCGEKEYYWHIVKLRVRCKERVDAWLDCADM